MYANIWQLVKERPRLAKYARYTKERGKNMAFKLGNIGKLLGYSMPVGAAAAIWQAYAQRGVAGLQADLTAVIKNPKGLTAKASALITGAIFIIAAYFISQAIQKKYTGKPTFSMAIAALIGLGGAYFGTQQILGAIKSGAGYGGITGASRSNGGNSYNPYQLGGN